MDGVRSADMLELRDAERRVVTEEFLRGRRAWPYGTVLMVVRGEGEEMEVGGYVRRAREASAADPVVYNDAGVVRLRRYPDLASLVEDGWRVD